MFFTPRTERCWGAKHISNRDCWRYFEKWGAMLSLLLFVIYWPAEHSAQQLVYHNACPCSCGFGRTGAGTGTGMVGVQVAAIGVRKANHLVAPDNWAHDIPDQIAVRCNVLVTNVLAPVLPPLRVERVGGIQAIDEPVVAVEALPVLAPCSTHLRAPFKFNLPHGGTPQCFSK